MALNYDRPAAIAYARQFWNTVCSDGFVCLKRDSIGKCTNPKNKDPFLAVPANTKFQLKAAATGDEEAVSPDSKVLLSSGCMDDSAHFVSCCIGTPPTIKGLPAAKGGGFSLRSSPKFPRAPYGATAADELAQALEKNSEIRTVLKKSAERKLPPFVQNGDVIVYSKDGRFTHAALFVTNDAVATHSPSRSPDSIALPSKWDYVADLDPGFRWSIYHFPNPIKPLVIKVGPFPGKYALELADNLSLQLCIQSGADDAIFFAEQTSKPSAKTLAAALIDLTGDPAKPPLSGFFETDTFYIGSMGKIAPMYAAFELRVRLQKIVNDAVDGGLDISKAGWHKSILKAVHEVWPKDVAKGFAGLDTKFPDRFPKLETVFNFPPGGVIQFKSAGSTTDEITAVGEFKRPPKKMQFLEWLILTIRWSNNIAASMVIDALEFPYINGALREAGFFDPPSKTGIWISGNYNFREWKKGVDYMKLSPRGKKHYKDSTNFVGNALEPARMLALAARHKLFGGDAGSCEEMITLMQKKVPSLPATTSFIADAVKTHASIDKVSSKIGIGDESREVPGAQGVHDCAILERTHSGKKLRYVAVVLGGYDNEGPSPDPFDRVALALDHCIEKAH